MSDTERDLRRDGFTRDDLDDAGMLTGSVGDDEVLVVADGDALHAVGASCTHYGAPLSGGLFDGRLLRCPWHHACFDVRTGAAERAPALDGIAVYDVTARDGRWYVTPATTDAPEETSSPDPVVVVGGGAAGHAAVTRLRDRGHSGRIVVCSADRDAPYDRPNVSKSYLAGEAPAEWMPLPGNDRYDGDVDLRLETTVTEIHIDRNQVVLDDGDTLRYDALVLATGAEPVTLGLDSTAATPVCTLRSEADADAVIAQVERLGDGAAAVVVGAGFIGLEVAAALRERGVSVDVVAPEELPLAAAVGEELGRLVRDVHAEHGVRFHLGRTVDRVTDDGVVLDDGAVLDAGLVVVGAGVRPRTGLAEQAGLLVDDGVVVDGRWRPRTTDGRLIASIRVAGDIASYPLGDRHVRIEHWAVAGRQGQAVADALLGRDGAGVGAPFFWSQHYDLRIRMVGTPAHGDRVEVRGDLQSRDASVLWFDGDDVVAVASVGRDRENLRAAVALERDDQEVLRGLGG